MRVFVGPLEIAGLGTQLVAGFRANGVQAEQVLDHPHPFAYAMTPAARGPAAWWLRIGAWRVKRVGRPALVRLAARALHALVGWFVLAWALARFDAFVFLYGQTITNTALEAWLLRLARKRTMMIFVGSDARPAYLDGGLFPADRPFDVAAAARAAARQRARVRRLERHIGVIVNARATGHFHAKRFINWFALGIPKPVDPTPVPPADPMVRIVHSPSHPALKGTARIVATVEALRARGLPVELVLLQGRGNAEVMQALRDCHLAVDQLYADTPMAGFAAEAASVGRPVIVAGCAAGRAPDQVAPLPLPPSVFVRPEEFEIALEALVRDAARREALGRAGAEFVAANWSPPAVAGRALRMLAGDIANAWWCHPAEVDHVAGCGLPEDVARARVKALLDMVGASALQVDDKPGLLSAFRRFAAGAAADERAAPTRSGAAS